MPPSLRDLVPGYSPDEGLNGLIPGYAPVAPRPSLRSPEVGNMIDQLEAADMNEVQRGYRSTRIGTDSSYLAGQEYSARRAGRTAEADALRSQLEASQARGAVYAPTEQSLSEVLDNPSLRRGADWLGSTVGGMAGSMLDPLAVGAAAGTAAKAIGFLPHPVAKAIGAASPFIGPGAALVPSVLQARGGTLQSMERDPTLMRDSTVESRDNASWVSGAAQGAIDTVLPGMFINRALGSGFKKGVASLAKPQAIGLEMLGSGAEEVAQDRLEKAALTHLNPDRDTSHDWRDAVDNFGAGFAGVAPISGASHVVDSGYRRLGIKGDGKNGDVLDLGGSPVAKPSVLETLNGRPSKFTRRAEAQKYADILSGSPADGVDANAQWMEENGPVRKSALLAELAKRKEPEAAAHAAEVSAVDDKDPMAVMDPRMDAASEWLLPKLHLTNEDIAKKRNAERVSSTDLGSRAGVGGTAEFEKLMLPDGTREKLGDVKFAAAQAEVKAHGQTAKLLTDRLWSAFGTNKESKPDINDRSLIQGLAQEVMAAATVDKPTEEEARRAQRLGEHLVRVVGPEAVPVLQGLTRTGGSTLLDHVIARATGVASMGSGLSHKQEQLSRTEAAVAFTNLVPPTVEQRLLRDHGIDLNDEKDQNDLLDLVEDFHDGRSNVTLMRLNKLLTAPVVKAMGLYLGNKIQPRLRGEEAVAQEHTSGTTKTTDADTEGTSGGKLVSGELMGEQSEAPTEYEAVGQEKSMDRVMPESMVFHHSGNKDGSIRDIKDAWKEDAKGELPQLLREGTGTPLLDRVKKLAQQAAAHLGNTRDRYVIGDPSSKDPLVAAGATSAKKLMDDTGMPDSKRAQLLFRYLAKENKDLDVGELEDMYKSVAYLGQLDRALTSTVTNRESLSPSGEKLSIPHSAEINAPHINYEKLADLAANPSDAAKVKELFKAGTISKYVGLAQIVRRAKAAAEQYLTTLPGYSEFVSKAEATDGRTPEFHEYVNDFFSQHHVVVAEQPTNRDHLQMSLPEFREMAMKGKANLKSAELAVVGSSMNDKARESERLRVEASMNLIRFKSSHSKAENGEVALPAHMLVAWVRKMRNAHETDGKNAPTKSNSPTKQTEDYKRDLMEGITTVMQNDLTDGLPWIINSMGKREDFVERTPGVAPGESPQQKQLFAEDKGSLPPSLDLDGITAKKADSDRAFGAAQRREAEEAHTASQSSLNAERGLAEKEERKNAELGQDDRDVQDADSVADAEAEANGPKTREEERANLKFMSSVMAAAADKGPRPLTVGGAMNFASRVADDLWRDYLAPGKRAEALARIMSYVRATDKEKYDEDASNDAHIMEGLWAEYNKAEEGSDEQDAILKRIEEQAATTNSGKQTTTAAVGSGMVGGQHYNFPLAALLTPRHMASLNPKDVAVMTMLRSRVASELLGMFHAKQISGGNLGKLVNFLSGYTDKTSQDMLDKKNPPDADLIKNRTPWQSTRIYQAGREAFLAEMAKPYQEMVTKRGPAVAKDVLGWVGHPMIEGQAGPVHKESARALQRMEAAVEDGPGVNRDAASTSAAAVAEAKTRLQAADARTSTSVAGLNTGTEGASQDKKLSIKAKKQRRENIPANGLNEALRGIAEPLGGARSDKTVSDEQTNKDTVDINQSVDKLAKVIGNSLDAREATTMEQKAEPAAQTGPAKVVIKQHASSGFAERTKQNADAAGATVAIATNFETAGERLTKRVAGNKYFPLGFDVPVAKAGLRLAKFMRSMGTTTLNVAGNGIYTLVKSGMTQQSVNQHVHDIIAAAHKLLPITHIVSGGQTGVDIAGAVAAKALGIPATITLPQGFRQRNEANQDVNNTAAQIGQQITEGVAGLGKANENDSQVAPSHIKRNAMATAIHNDLERGGFAATHDSPHKHEGKFDWRAHQGKGEGNAAFGAGTYLSTSDGVHKSYKGQFTAQAERAAKAPAFDAATERHLRDLEYVAGELLDAHVDAQNALYSAVLSGSTEAREQAKKANDVAAERVEQADKAYTAAYDAAVAALPKTAKSLSDKSPTYEVSVDIPADQLLDWDKPLREQSAEVQKAFEKAGFVDNEAKIQKALQRYIDAQYDLQAIKKDEQTERKARDAKGVEYYDSHPFETVEDPSDIALRWAKKKNAANEKIKAAHLEWRIIKEQGSSHTFTGGQLYAKLSGHLGSQTKASDYLQSKGILGHKYAASGGRNDAHPNYVIYDDSKITTNYVHFNAEVLTAPTAEQSAKAAANPPKQLQVTAALAHFKRTLSDKVKVLLQDAFPDMTHGADYNTLEHLARISTANPLKIMQLAYHESMHGFFDTVLNAKGNEAIKAMMQKAMSEPKVYARLKDMLRDSPDALADMERDPEERVAYAYQFWAAGMLSIAQKPTTFFQRVQALMRQVFNAVSDSEKALAMFEAFHKGELKEPSAAGKAMLKIMQSGEWRKAFLKRFDKQVQAVYAEVMANHLVGRNSESATARKINNMWYSNPAYGSDTAEDGVINRTQMMRKKYINRLRLALAPLKGPNADRDLKALGEALNAHTTPELAHVAKAKVAVQALLKQYHAYAREAGIDLGERFGTDGDNDYFTRVMDLEKLIDGKEAFTSMLMTKYPHVLKPAISLLQRTAPEGSKVSEIDVANAIHQMYIDHNGVDDNKLSAMREDGILNPFFAAQNKRELYWIKDADIAPFLNTDAVGTLTQYISQGVRAAEYARAFGQGGADLKDMMAREGDVQTVDKDGVPTLYTEDGPVASELVAAAEKQGLKGKKAEEWVNRRVDDLRRSHGAYEGSLGKDITAEIRKLQAGAMIYQTLRLLPLMLFSSMLDPNGIRVAGGTSDDMWNAYKRGFAGLWMNWKDMFLGNPFGSRDPDAKEMAALEAGVIDSDMELEEMGQVHSSEYSSGITRHIGHAFFKAIGITQWDRDMRISAVDAARKSIVSSFNNEVPEHSPRWLKEVGLKREQVFINVGGDLIVSARELALKNNISRVEAAKLLEPTHLAINRWVNRAIVSPNAGLRPTRFSDPHFAMFAQFKSFTYAFQETTLRYAAHEAEQGNFNSGAQLLRGIPIMIAADMTKAMITGGGSLPGYMANWSIADWVSHAINRSGIGGTGTFATDILNGDIANTLAGPTVGHAWDTVEKVATGEAGKAITNSIPLVKQFAGGMGHARHALESAI